MDELVRRCSATSKTTGNQCGRAPILGGSVCALHGGKAPQTVAAAKARLLEGVEPAIARLMRFIEAPPGLCALCGRSDDTGAIVSAIRTLLDRCGLGPSATMQVVATVEQPYVRLSTDEMIAKLEALLDMDLIRFGGHLLKGGYDVHNGRDTKPAAPPALH